MSETMESWTQEFGQAYTDRNICNPEELDAYHMKTFGLSRTCMNADFLKDRIPKDARILEVGCNVGNNLRLLQQMGYTCLYGIEIQAYAIQRAKALTEDIHILYGQAQDIPFKDGFFDLVFTNGVLIHIHPDQLDAVIDEMVRCTNSYIWGFEYYAPKMVDIPYRGKSGMLWKGDYCQRFQERHQGLALVLQKKYSYIGSDLEDAMYLLCKNDAP